MPVIKTPLPSREYLREALDYSRKTGLFMWKTRPVTHFREGARSSARHAQSVWNSRYAGTPAFRIVHPDRNTSYLYGKLNRSKLASHRVAWKWVTGEDPDIIDHIDGNGFNNCFQNLRSVSHSENLNNRVNAK